MTTPRLLYFGTLLFVSLITFAQKDYTYPAAFKDTTSNTYFGEKILDTYQWMENPSDPRLSVWLDEQRRITKKLSNQQTRIWDLRAQFLSIQNDVKKTESSTVVKRSKELKSKYQFKTEMVRMGQSPNSLYRLRAKKSTYHTFFKSKDHRRDKNDHPEVADRLVNEDEDLMAFWVSHNGSDWQDIFIYDLKAGKQLDDTLKYTRGSTEIVWHGRNLIYDRFAPPGEGLGLLKKATNQELYYHKLGDKQKLDQRLFQNPDTTGTNSFKHIDLDDKLFIFHSYRHKDKIYKALSVADKDPESFYFKNILIYPNKKDLNMSVETLFGDTLVVKTDWNAPNGKVLLLNINKTNDASLLIPEFDAVLQRVDKLGKDKIVAVYRSGGQPLVLIYNLAGELLKKMTFPEGKKVQYFYEYEEDAKFTEYCISSFFHPDLWFQISLDGLTSKPMHTIRLPYNHKSLETRFIKFKSKDGTEIPMYITCKKETQLNGKNPTLLYGYGGYGVTVEPEFNRAQALWLIHGGVLAMPNVRGGGAGGSQWELDGKRLKKQNTIDDFLSAAEYLIDEGYTSNKKLAISGGSHGGMLVAAAMTQRPELFKAVVAEAGAFDMLRFNRFTAGGTATNINEFGITTDPLDYQNLKSYSPLHRIENGVKYPNTLLITGDSDDRVPPLHSYKFLAALQEQSDPKSLLHLYLVPGAGHGGALTQQDFENKLLYKYYYLFSQLGVGGF